MRGGRLPANLATLANLLVGLGAILYVGAGNPLWAMLLITSGVAFDGLDGFLARRSGLGPSRFGRVFDSVADATTFGLAPAALLVVHTDHASLWQPYALAAWGVGLLFAALSIARLIYFTVRGYQNPDFLGAPTPQSALAIVVLCLLLNVPGFLGVDPVVLLGAAVAIAVVMVLPIPYPKIRRGHPIRLPLAVSGTALVVALLPVQFRVATGSAPYLLAEIAAAVALVGVATYYLVGPFTVPKAAPHGP
jgi:CDP-diacylglycerol---serine O-phosphatidyltransferase